MTTPDEALFTRTERVLIGLGALVLITVVAVGALNAEIAHSRRAFSVESHNIALQVSRRLAEGETLIAALHGFYDSGDALTDARFPAIAERFLEDHPQVLWIASAEQVDGAAEADFEHRLHRQGFMNMRIHTFDDAGIRAESGLRLPIYRLEPLSPGNARLLGADVASHQQWRGAIAGAVRSGELSAVATRAPTLGLHGVLLLRAIYRGNVEPDNALAREQQLAGMLMLFLDANELVAGLATSLSGVSTSIATGIDNAGPASLASTVPPGLFGDWDERQSMVLPASVADIFVPLRISAPLEPQWWKVAAASLVTALVLLSLLHGLRQRRMARREERRTFVQAELAEITLHSIGEAVIRLDEHGCVRYMNPIAEAMSGMENADARGWHVEDVLDVTAKGQVSTHSLARLRDGRAEVLLNSPGGEARTLACTVSPITDAAGGLVGRVLVMRDVSRENQLSRELAHQASHDPLTDLPNRRAFERRLVRAVTDARRLGMNHTLFYIDLDQFKLVNDTSGHAAGDRMLRQIAGLLANEVREGDMLARLGGDEFGVLLAGCSVERAMPFAERICHAVSSFRFVADGRNFELGASIGVVEIGRDSGTAEDVQRAADLACYAAKDSGRNRVHLYRQEDTVIRRNHAEMQWHAEIQAALQSDRMVLYAQPIRRVRRGKGPLQMHEMLLRMLSTEGELVPPMAFLPAAERYGLMGAVDRAVIEKSFVHVARVDVVGHVFTINLSGQSFTDPGLGDFIVDAAHRTGADPQHICFEVTETAAISNLAQAGQLMQRLHGEGFRFALDDFGAGLSSFAYLKELPVDFIKIDGQFVRDINTDPVARAMVTSIVNVAQVLGITTVAEKVEHADVQSCLRSLGVDYVQGFLVGKPQPVEKTMILARSA